MAGAQNSSGLIGNGRWRPGARIARHDEVAVYAAETLATGEMVAIKLEPESAREPRLMQEYKSYRKLEKENMPGIPRPRAGFSEKGFNVLVMDLLGPTLEDLWILCNRKFSERTVTLLADQLITRIEDLHSRGYVWRGVRPDNFCMGLGDKCSEVYLIDLSLCTPFLDKAGAHVEYQENLAPVGSAYWLSLNAHYGIEQSRRDDLESLGYVLLYFLKGWLPWHEIDSAKRHLLLEKVQNKKSETTLEELCEDVPGEYLTFLEYARGLEFDQKPDYDFLRSLFTDLADTSGWEADGMYDWHRLNVHGGSVPTPARKTQFTTKDLSKTKPVFLNQAAETYLLRRFFDDCARAYNRSPSGLTEEGADRRVASPVRLAATGGPPPTKSGGPREKAAAKKPATPPPEPVPAPQRRRTPPVPAAAPPAVAAAEETAQTGEPEDEAAVLFAKWGI